MVLHKTDPALQELLHRVLPQARLHEMQAVTGLSGQSWRLETSAGTLLARRTPTPAMPQVNRQREFRQLLRLRGSGLAQQPLAASRDWLLLRWQPGEVVAPEALASHLPQLLALLGCLHRQPLCGYRLSLLPLLQRYWQQCQQRHPSWLRALRHLQQQGEPKPLRLAFLHMDVHAGNLICQQGKLSLIDWEYAGDGDIALELATLCATLPQHTAQLIADFAQRYRLSPDVLQQQIHRWQPWLRLLMASWYQLRAEQTQSAAMRHLARQHWQQLHSPF
ncbi:thiamine kinase [Pantoea sp. A4]|uniref:thiamine kinase n=1 Tax=Pantoea sp. A4 TaxID=1225184 RepID=UPI00035CCAA8